MVQNYYSLKRRANLIIKQSMEYLKANPTSVINISLLTIKFQEQFGFGERTLLTMLKPYIDAGMIKLVDGELICPVQ